jgi:hypothetical protein
MTEKIFIKILQQIKQLLNAKNLTGYLFVLGIRDEKNIMVFHHFYKDMNNPDINKILDDSKTKINDEFSTKLLPITLSHTRADA